MSGALATEVHFRTSTFRVKLATLVMMLHHCNCLLFIIIPPVTIVQHDAEKNIMRKESMVDKT